MQINLTPELKKLIGADVPENLITIKDSPMAWRMRIKFDTKLLPHELLTKDIRFHNPGWGDEDQFQYPILYMELFLPIKYKVYMGGMEQYNFFIEVVGDMSGGKQAEIQSFWLCGKLPFSNDVKMITVNKGMVVTNTQPFGKEYYGTASRGWKKGSPSKCPICTLIKI
ncbi:hypothetical protein LCGC14_2728650 [marine sediment metagenome]|uniref:Uncharacterized protein n=1 Tax=marine sediment metagenome TaxID=412755 RepID=A0A0F8Z864_9ZZZZ